MLLRDSRDKVVNDLLRIHRKDFQQWLEDKHNKGEVWDGSMERALF